MNALPPLYPLLLKPSLHVKVWGGRSLEAIMNKSLPTDEPYGEAWELHDTATVMNGTLEGKTIGELLLHYGTDLVGAGNDPKQGLPLLAKLLDSSSWLSIQVHPNDKQARQLENEPRGKTEAWIILNAEPGARLAIGVKPGTTHKQMAQAIRQNTLENLLVYANVKADDILFVRANTIHAVGPGILLYEIQQSSNTTYRLYDWGHLGLDGQPRELHIEKGLQIANLETLPDIQHIPDQSGITTIIHSDYFQTDLIRITESTNLSTKGRFHALTCIEGTVDITMNHTITSMNKGQTVLIPACLEDYELSGTPDMRLLNSYQT